MATATKSGKRRKGNNMGKRVTKAMQAAAEGWNQSAARHAAKAQRRAWAIKRRHLAEDLTAQRRARYFARIEKEELK